MERFLLPMKRLQRCLLLLSAGCLAFTFSAAANPRLRRETSEIVGEASTPGGYEQRYRRIHTASRSVYIVDRERFIEFLRLDPQSSPLEEAQLASLKNDVADRMLQIGSSADDLARLFLEQIDDPAMGALWHSYVLQKLGPAALEVGDPALSRALVERLKAFLYDPASDSPGTALIGLHELAAGGGSVGIDLGGFCVGLLRDRRYDPHSRATALTIGAELGESGCRDYAKEVLQRADEPIALRIAAIATLGIFAKPPDRSILERYAESADLRLAQPAQFAIGCIQATDNR